MSKAEENHTVATAGLVVRACCRTAPERATYFEPSDSPADIELVIRPTTEADLVGDPVVAHHEAGHAVVGLLFGMLLTRVVAGTGGFVRWATKAPTLRAHLLMTLADDFSGGLVVRWEYRPTDAELTPWLDLIRQPAGGSCDRCQIMRALVVEAGLDAPDAVVLAAYRAAEIETLAILRRTDVRAAIRAVADALMTAGELTGDAATAIAARFIAPGELTKETIHENS